MLRTTLAIVRKDVLDILLNKSTLVMLLTPIFITIVFAVISGLFGSAPPRLLIYNPGHSHVSQVIARTVTQSQTVTARSPGEVVSAFTHDHSTMYVLGLIIPSDFDARLSHGERPQLTLYLNGDEMNEVQRQQVIDTLTKYANSISNPQPPMRIDLTMVNTPSFSFNLDMSKFYLILALFNLITVDIALVTTLLVEEKERKTLRMILSSPATLPDVVIGKLLVGLGYLVVVLGVVMALLNGFVGNLPLVLLYMLLISCFGLALSLYAGSVFRTTTAVGGFLGISGLLFVIPAIYVGPIGVLFGNNQELLVLHLLPTYYMADGLMNALQNQSVPTSVFLDVVITLGCTVLCLWRAISVLHRQTTVTATV